jgi:AcrR family transcriptional regulator
MTDTPVKRGRPRSEAIDEAIIDATVEELITRGFLGLSMEAVAARAGVAKTTLYRRWPNTTELAYEAMRSFESEVRPPPDGSVRDQLVCLVNAMRRKWSDPRYSAIMRRVTVDGAAQPEAYRDARDRLVAPHLNLMNAVLQRGVDEGLIRDDVDLSWIRQMLTSPIMAATLTFKDRVSKTQVEACIDIVLRGLAP